MLVIFLIRIYIYIYLYIYGCVRVFFPFDHFRTIEEEEEEALTEN